MTGVAAPVPAVQPEPPVLLKQDALRLRKAEASLRPFQDEKLEHAQKAHSAAMNAFNQARGARSGCEDLYAGRAAEIAAKIDAMQARADKAAHACLESMKGLATEFDASVTKGKKEWRKEFNKRQKENVALNAAADEDVSALAAAIQEEHEACEAHSAAEIEPITKALQAHSEVLGSQVAERQEHQKELREELDTEFSRLRGRLQKEQERRERQCKESRQNVSGYYEELKAKLEEQHASMRQRLEALSGRIAEEKGERAETHQVIVDKMVHIMEEFEKNMSKVRQGAAEHTARLNKLRKQLYQA